MPADRAVRRVLNNTPLVDRSDFADLLAKGHFGLWSEQARSLNELGYCTLELDDPSFSKDCQEVISSLQTLLAPQLEEWEAGRAGSSRLQDGWRDWPAVRHLALHPSVLALLRCVYGREPFAFQTLNFATGSEQSIHSDAVHFHCEPHGFMCGVWIPLADVSADSGPLVYYPGSHRLPYHSAASLGLTPDQVAAEPHPQRFFEPVWQEDVGREALEPQLFLPRRGQILVWHANLLHGGSPVLNRQARRWSQVVHYYFADCIYTTPLMSFPPEHGGPSLRNPCNVATGRQLWTPAAWSRLNLIQTPPSQSPPKVPSPRPLSSPRWFKRPGLWHRPPARTLKGNLELITPSLLTGWAYHPEVPLSEVRLVCGLQLVAMATISGDRPDVASALGEDGCFGFQLDIPELLPILNEADSLQVWALPADCSSRHLLTLPGASAAETDLRLRAALAPERLGLRGHFDGLSADGSELSGWCYSRSLATANVWLHCPGLPPRSLSCSLPRPGMASQGHVENCGFSLLLSEWPEAAGREVWACFDEAGELRLPPLVRLVLPEMH